MLLANQLYYGVQADAYDAKNHVHSGAILRFYRRLIERHVFDGVSAADARRWRALDVGCGTGFMETVLGDRVGSVCGVDATSAMLLAARRKFGSGRVTWMQADALRLPYRDASFDLICANAILHHVQDVHGVLSGMIPLLKPGGRLLLGYEPNAIAYRWLKPLLVALARFCPEERDLTRIRQASGQDAHARLAGRDLHKLTEYHIFYGAGIHPFELRRLLSALGVVGMRVHFSSVYQAALLRDVGVPLPINRLPDWVFRLTGRLSLSFALTGRKAR